MHWHEGPWGGFLVEALYQQPVSEGHWRRRSRPSQLSTARAQPTWRRTTPRPGEVGFPWLRQQRPFAARPRRG